MIKGNKVKVLHVPTGDTYYETSKAKEEYLKTVGKEGIITYVTGGYPHIFDVKFEGDDQTYSYEQYELELV